MVCCVDVGFVCFWLCWLVFLAGPSGCFLLYFPLFACASGRAVVFVSSSVSRRRRLLPVGLVPLVLWMQFSMLSLHGDRALLKSASAIRYVCVCVCVFVRSRRPWPWFSLSVPLFYLLSVSLVGGLSSTSYCLVSAVLLRASVVAHSLVCVQLSYVYFDSR